MVYKTHNFEIKTKSFIDQNVVFMSYNSLLAVIFQAYFSHKISPLV